MIWLKLVWYVFWRGLLYGGIVGIVFGTLASPFAGTVYGMVIGTFSGAILGLVNGITLAAMTCFFFNPPTNRQHYQRWIMIATTPIDLITVLVCAAFAGSFLSIGCALTTATIAYFLITGYADYAIALLAQNPSQQPPAKLQISH